MATVVLVHPPVEAEGAAAMPLFQRGGRGVWFRFTVGDARPITDLDAGTYTASFDLTWRKGRPPP